MLRHIALLVADEPELAGAVTNALLGKDPDVEHLRLRIGREINKRLTTALGPDDTTLTSSSHSSCSTPVRWCAPEWDTRPTSRSPIYWRRSARKLSLS